MTDSVIAVSGSAGLVGSRLVADLRTKGHRVIRLVRRAAALEDERSWSRDGCDLSGIDTVVHLAGESIAAGIWTAARKRAILESRVDGTCSLAKSCREHSVQHLICASAVGFYGDRDQELLTEASPPGTGFLSEVCQAWEREALDAAPIVTRVRFGQILSWDGGALAVQARLYRFFLGARLGNGLQWMPWISHVDACAALGLALETRLDGPLNLTAPVAARQQEFHARMARHLGRPAFPAVPAFLLDLLPGGFGRELLLSSAKVLPVRLQTAGFAWKHPDLETFLK